jgi:hypothetical protein
MSNEITNIFSKARIPIDTDVGKYLGQLYLGNTAIDSRRMDVLTDWLKITPIGIVRSMHSAKQYTDARAWNIYHALREHIQNAADASGPNGTPAPMGYRPNLLMYMETPYTSQWQYDHMMGIADTGPGISPKALYYGFSRKLVDAIRYRGIFGEGLKGALSVYAMSNEYVTAVHTQYRGEEGVVAYSIVPFILNHTHVYELVYLIGESHLDRHGFTTVAVHAVSPFSDIDRGAARAIIAFDAKKVAGMVFSTYLDLLRYNNIKYEVVKASEIMGKEAYLRHLLNITSRVPNTAVKDEDVEKAVSMGYIDTYVVAYDADNIGRRIYLRDLLLTDNLSEADGVIKYCRPGSTSGSSFCHEFTYNLPFAPTSTDRRSTELFIMRKYAETVLYSEKLLTKLILNDTKIRRSSSLNYIFIEPRYSDMEAIELNPTPVTVTRQTAEQTLVKSLQELGLLGIGNATVIRLTTAMSLVDVEEAIKVMPGAYVLISNDLFSDIPFMKSSNFIASVSSKYDETKIITTKYVARASRYLLALARGLSRLDNLCSLTFRSGYTTELGVTTTAPCGIEISLNIDMLDSVVNQLKSYGAVYDRLSRYINRLLIVLFHEMAHAIVMTNHPNEVAAHGAQFLFTFEQELLHEYASYLEPFGYGLIMALYGIVPNTDKIYPSDLIDSRMMYRRIYDAITDAVIHDNLVYLLWDYIREYGTYGSWVHEMAAKMMTESILIGCIVRTQTRLELEALDYQGYDNFTDYLQSLPDNCVMIIYPMYNDIGSVGVCAYVVRTKKNYCSW